MKSIIRADHIKKFWKYQTITKWILTGCIILIIPIICAVINFVINKRVLEKKIGEVNNFMLQNIQYNVDNRLKNMQNMGNYLLLNGNFDKYTLTHSDDDKFHQQIDSCYSQMKQYYSANHDMDIMMYLPDRDYMMTTTTSNSFSYTYDSLFKIKKITMTMDEWKNKLLAQTKGSSTIVDYMSYRNFGRESLVYVAQGASKGGPENFYVFLSTPVEFLQKLAENEGNKQNSIFIVDDQNRIVGQFGREINIENVECNIKDNKNFSFSADGEQYIGSMVSSKACSWKYVYCTPKSHYLQDIKNDMTINILIIFFSAVAGIVILVLLQYRNYKPLNNLIKQLPKDGSMPLDIDEYSRVERVLKTLYHENYNMKNTLKDRREHEKEWILLNKIRNRYNALQQEASIASLMACNSENTQYLIVTVSANLDDNKKNSFVEDYSLLSFAIHNVVSELFAEGYHYLRTMDDMYYVYLFALDNSSFEAKLSGCEERFNKLCQFFSDNFDVDLAVTIGETFPSENYIGTAYAKIQEANELRYFEKPDGVLKVESMKEIDPYVPERLNYYRRRFEGVLIWENLTDINILIQELFAEFHKTGESMETMRYYIASIVADMLVVSKGMMQKEVFSENAWNELMEQLSAALKPADLSEAFLTFMLRMHRSVEEESSYTGLADTIREYVLVHYQDDNLNISTIADKVGMTPRYMSRLFKDQTGTGLLDFINEVRIQQAEHLLKNTAKTVEEITDEVGYTNTRTFRRNFLKYTGENPADYRNHLVGKK